MQYPEDARPTTNPILSVVTICLNDATGLQQTLSSLPIASADWEHVIVDGGSTDGSWEIAQEYASERDNARAQSGPDKGIYDAMNKGILQCRGRFVWFLNAGDVVATAESMKVVLDALRNFNGVLAMGHVLHGEIGRRSTSFPFDNWKFWTGRQGYNHQGCLISADFLRAIGGHDTTRGFAADLYVLAKAVAVAPPLEIRHDIASYKGGGYSSGRVAGTPLEFHRARTELLALPHTLRVASRVYALAQIARRHGFKVARRESALRTRNTR